MISPRRSIVGILLIAPVFGACRDVAPAPGKGVVATRSTGPLPIDVAVLPIVNSTGKSDGSVPASAMREAFQKKLVEQRYSPLALDFVDKNVVDASYRPETPSDQAVLKIQLEKWDTSQWETHNAISVRLVAHLVDASSAGASSASDLWTGTVDQRFDFGSDADRFTTESARMTYACQQIAGTVLARLPARQPKPGAVSN